MHPSDEDKTAFTTGRGIYCYKMLPLGLKNAGVTFQLMVDKVSKDMIGRTMKMYVDDMLVKSVLHADHLQHLGEGFDLLQKYKVKLNPEKCTFRVASEKFLWYLVTQRCIETDLNQIFAILNMK